MNRWVDPFPNRLSIFGRKVSSLLLPEPLGRPNVSACSFLKRSASLEPVHDLLSNSTRNAKWTNCRLVFNFRSQFFHSLQHLSSQAKERSTIQRCGITSKVCNSFRLVTTFQKVQYATKYLIQINRGWLCLLSCALQ